MRIHRHKRNYEKRKKERKNEPSSGLNLGQKLFAFLLLIFERVEECGTPNSISLGFMGPEAQLTQWALMS